MTRRFARHPGGRYTAGGWAARLVSGFGAALLCAVAASADCGCLDTDADGYPDRDGACQGNSVSQVSPTPGKYPTQSPAQIGITFDRELVCGQYINGDYWVVEPSAGAGVTVASTSPEFKRTNDDWYGARWKHGYQIDPVRVDAMQESSPQGQSFDERVVYFLADGKEGRAKSSFPMPVQVSAGQSFVKAHSKPVWGGVPAAGGKKGCLALREKDGGPGGEGQTCVRAYMVLTVLGQAPESPSDTFRPPYVGRWDRGNQRRDLDWRKPGTRGKQGYRFADLRWAAFPKLDHTRVRDKSLYIHDFALIRDHFRLPQIEINPHHEQRRLRAFDPTSGGPLGGSDYAADWTKVTNRSWLRFTGADVAANPAEPGFQKVQKHALVNLLQFGIDQLHLVRDGDKMYYPDGGHYAGGYLPALMACHMFSTPNPTGYDVSPECAWMERNKTEGSTQDVGYPMWGEQTLVYRNPLGLDQRQICTELEARAGHSCAELGIDPLASKPLYGQKYGQRAYNDTEKDAGGDESCLWDWNSNVSTHCRDPYQHIDHPGNACKPDPDQSSSNYERIMQPNLRHVALTARLFGVFQADGSGPFPNHIWDFAARRYWLGYETQPDLAPQGGNPQGYSGGEQRCTDLHHKHACVDDIECYPWLKEYPPVCWSCLGMMDEFATYLHDAGPGSGGGSGPPPPPADVLPAPLLVD